MLALPLICPFTPGAAVSTCFCLLAIPIGVGGGCGALDFLSLRVPLGAFESVPSGAVRGLRMVGEGVRISGTGVNGDAVESVLSCAASVVTLVVSSGGMLLIGKRLTRREARWRRFGERRGDGLPSSSEGQ
jgi:hypothetical protein